jgi:hypothetical protein
MNDLADLALDAAWWYFWWWPPAQWRIEQEQQRYHDFGTPPFNLG